MNDKVRQTLASILLIFQSGEIPEAIAVITFPKADIPSNDWSFLNRLLMFVGETHDARGYQQWKQVNRFVKKGAKAIFIFAPNLKKEKDDRGKEVTALCGFRAVPVYRCEDTEGQELEYKKIELPEFPLMERAREWNLEVKAIPGGARYYGYYAKDKIVLATAEETVFFHELAHAAHDRIKGGLKKGQDPLQEIVADLSSEVISRIVGRKSDTTGNCYRYIESYAKKIPMSPVGACLQVLHEVEQVINLIIGKEASHATSCITAGLPKTSQERNHNRRTCGTFKR